jgi:hypothetical protein
VGNRRTVRFPTAIVIPGRETRSVSQTPEPAARASVKMSGSIAVGSIVPEQIAFGSPLRFARNDDSEKGRTSQPIAR